MTKPMMDEDSVVALMRSSTCEQDWKDNCDAVKHDNGGDYPDFWFRAIVQNHVKSKAEAGWHGW